MRPITYSLNDLRGKADFFYWQLKRVTDIVLWKAERLIGSEVNQHIHFLKYLNLEKPRAKNEYYLEVILLSVLWREYAHKAILADGWKLRTLSSLYTIRQASSTLKPLVDRVRAARISRWLSVNDTEGNVEVEPTLENFNKLLNWLSASGDFYEECARLRNWQQTLLVMPQNYADRTLRRVVAFAPCFSDLCSSTLGEFTWRVDTFLSNNYSNYRGREDYIFCGRSEAEYHLNMIGAEIMNRVQRDRFLNRPAKAALLPTCMRSRTSAECKAIDFEGIWQCVGCSKDCNIGMVQKELSSRNMPTYIAPHRSDFSRFIKRWQHDKSIGIVGVACVLNLIKGGYEMRKFDIPSQCVFLDHCGCKKHWDSNGVPTTISIAQLNSILSKQNEPINVDETVPSMLEVVHLI